MNDLRRSSSRLGDLDAEPVTRRQHLDGELHLASLPEVSRPLAVDLVDDAAEDQFLIDIYRTLPSNDRMWIGLSDRAIEGTFEWVDGTPVTFENWAPGMPDNNGGAQDCAVYGPGGQWDDVGCAFGTFRAIIEFP